MTRSRRVDNDVIRYDTYGCLSILLRIRLHVDRRITGGPAIHSSVTVEAEFAEVRLWELRLCTPQN